MELEKGTLVTIKGTAKFSKFIGIINSISSDMAINFKVLLDNNRNILSFNNLYYIQAFIGNQYI